MTEEKNGKVGWWVVTLTIGIACTLAGFGLSETLAVASVKSDIATLAVKVSYLEAAILKLEKKIDKE